MKMNNFYTASYLGARLNQLFCSGSKMKLPRDWNTLMINSKNKGSGKITHTLFYESLLKVSRDFCKRYAEYFTEQERYVMIRYIIKLLCFDILRKNYFDVHVQNIQFVYASEERYKLKNVERNNEKCLDKMVSEIDFRFLLEDLFSRYFPRKKMGTEECSQILEEMQRQEFLPASYLQQCHQILKWTSKHELLDIRSSNEEVFFRCAHLYLEQDEHNYCFHVHKEKENLKSFFQTVSAEIRCFQLSGSKIEWMGSPNTAGYTRQKTQLNVSTSKHKATQEPHTEWLCPTRGLQDYPEQIRSQEDPQDLKYFTSLVEKDLFSSGKKRGDRKGRRR